MSEQKQEMRDARGTVRTDVLENVGVAPLSAKLRVLLSRLGDGNKRVWDDISWGEDATRYAI